MKVLNFLSFFLIFFNSTVLAQIVTPSLDPSVLSLMPATAGWRDKTNFNGSLETFSETDFDSNESKISNLSYMVSSRLVNNIYQESFSSTSNVDKKYSNLFANLNEKSKIEETKFNVAFGLGQPIGGHPSRYFIGISYSSARIDEEASISEYAYQCKTYSYYTNWKGEQIQYCIKYELVVSSVDSNTVNKKKTAFGLGVSFNIWQLLYASYGIQQTSITDGEASISETNYRFLGNKWLDRYYGFSIKSTKPGVPKFRLEWSYILSPSATNAADSSSSSKATEVSDVKDRTETQIRNMEFSPTMLNNWVFFLHLKVNKTYKDYLTGDGEYENKTDEQISSGVLWGYSGQKGLSIGLRYIDSKTYLNTTKNDNYLQEKIQVSTGKGYRLSVDFEF